MSTVRFTRLFFILVWAQLFDNQLSTRSEHNINYFKQQIKDEIFLTFSWHVFDC